MTMTGKISPNGNLFIERVNGEVLQACPHGKGSCNHCCPFFEELDNIYDGDYGNQCLWKNQGNLKSRRISVCGRIIEINKDERE